MRKIIVLLISCLLNNSCYSNNMLSDRNNPEKNFDHLWNAFDKEYAAFNAKNINWDAIYKVYRPRVNSETSDDQLFAIMSEMLAHLNDNHVNLRSNKLEQSFNAGLLQSLFFTNEDVLFNEIMSKRPVPDEYFEKGIEVLSGGVFAYSWLPDNIGYFHFNSFGNRVESSRAIDKIIDEFRDSKAIIVDVRRNGGGDDRVGKLIADRFADSKKLYMTTEVRNGSNHDDFNPKKYWYTEPDGILQFTKPVVLLTDRTSISAAENFTLAMRNLPNVTVVGDFTSGCFADVKRGRLPNGWMFSLAYNLFLDSNGFCWEGIGIPPDIRQNFTFKEIENGIDKILELAIDLINSSEL